MESGLVTVQIDIVYGAIAFGVWTIVAMACGYWLRESAESKVESAPTYQFNVAGDYVEAFVPEKDGKDELVDWNA